MKLIIKLALIALIFDYSITGLLYNPPLADEENFATKRMLDFGTRLDYVLFASIAVIITGLFIISIDGVVPFLGTAIATFLFFIHLYGGWTWVSYYYGF